MQDLRLIGVHEDGGHLLLADDAGERFRLPIDEPLRAGVRPGPKRSTAQETAAAGAEPGLRPRDVQALIRAGASAEEAAERAGWSVEKVHRFEGPILAEREHIAGLARAVQVRGRTAGGGATVQTVEGRVSARLADRGVDAEAVEWDAWRRDSGPWTVVAVFAAGGRERRASWQFDPADRALTAVDDEARWLSGDEQAPQGPIPTTSPRRRTRVYDVEAEGGLRSAASEHADDDGEGTPAASSDAATDADEKHAHHAPLDLMSAMRQRSGARGRRSGRRGRKRSSEAPPPATSPANVPGAEDVPDDALPLEDVRYDPETMAPPPAAHGHPGEDEPTAAHGPAARDDAVDAEDATEDAGSSPVAAFETPGLFDEEAEDGAPEASVEEVADDETPTDGQDDPDDADDVTNVTGPESGAHPSDDFRPEDEPADRASAPEPPVDGTDGTDDPPAEETDRSAARVAEEAPAPSKPRRRTRKSGRPSVPSWDDVMFGAPRGQN